MSQKLTSKSYYGFVSSFYSLYDFRDIHYHTELEINFKHQTYGYM